MRKLFLFFLFSIFLTLILFAQDSPRPMKNVLIDLYNDGEYEKVEAYYDQLYSGMENADDDIVYIAALSCFCNTKYAKTAEILQNVYTKTSFSMFPSQTELYAASLVNLGDFNGAVKAYEVLEKNKKLTESTTLEYAASLYKIGQYKKSYDLTKKLSSTQGIFICANSAFGLKNYSEAIKKYNTLLEQENLSDDVESEARFFKSYSYRLLAEEAFAKNDKSNAIKNYEMYLQTAADDESRKKAVETLASVYTDYKMFDKAISVYEPYTKRQDEFAAECLYKSAEIYAKAGNPKKSAETYYLLFEKFFSSKYSEDALFRGGEILYLIPDYKNAAKYFEEYTEYYPSGKYADSCSYYIFDSYVQTGEKTKAILYGKLFIQKYPSSTFLPAVKQTLAQLEKVEEPKVAELSEAEKLLSKANELYDSDKKSEAAENYLLAAEYFRKENDGDKVALCLYTATECFVHLGKKGDAEETAKLLNQLYPNSRYASAVGNLLK